tara:strand:+ start:290 stop:1192 length:903 start_codon:yes stop_codon:yes gene_type:complete
MNLVASKRNVNSYFLSYILQRIERNKNFLCCISGGTGSGKSLSALRVAELLDPDFDIRQVVFDPIELMSLVNGKTKKLKRGNVILFDEMQVSMGHLSFQSVQNKMINYLLQTFRHQNLILIVTTPSFNYIDKSARMLFHSRWETVKIMKQKKLCKLKPYLIQWNQKSGKAFEKWLRVATGGGVAPCKSIAVGLPSKELWDKYEAKKTQFTSKLNEEIEKELSAQLDKKKNTVNLTQNQKDVLKLLKSGLRVDEMANTLDVTNRWISSIMESLRKKGYEITAKKNESTIISYNVRDTNEAL